LGAHFQHLGKSDTTGAGIVDCLLADRASAGMIVCSFDRDMDRLNASWEEPG